MSSRPPRTVCAAAESRRRPPGAAAAPIAFHHSPCAPPALLPMTGRMDARVSADLAHDLRMPLEAMLARAERILGLATDEPLRAEALALRLAAAAALARLDGAVADAHRPPGAGLALAEGDLAATVRRVADQFAPLAEARRIALEPQTPARLTASFDAERISRALANLLANAIRFTPAGGRVRCSLRIAGERAELEVADSGPGIPPEERADLFARRAPGSHPAAGTGLGLAIVRESVALHTGTVTLDTAPEGGARFTIALPLHAATAAPATLAQHVAAARQAELVRSSLEAELARTRPPAAIPR